MENNIQSAPKNKNVTLVLAAVFLILGGLVVWVTTKNKSSIPGTLPNSNSMTAGLTYKGQVRTSADPGFGYNGFFIEGFMKNKANNINKNVEALDKVMSATNATWLRFPGGTRANSYVFDLTAPGLGQDSSFDKSFPDNFLVNYADIAKAVNAKTAYVIDMTAHFPSYYGIASLIPPRVRNKTDNEIIKMNVDAVAYLLEHGNDVPVIELGNELYIGNLSPSRNSKVPNKTLTEVEQIMKPEMDRYETLVNQYIAAFNDLAQRESAILGRTVSFKYGVPILMPPGAVTNGKQFVGPLASRNIYWNNRVTALPVDAFVIHAYSDFGPCKSIFSNPQTFRACEIQKDNEDVINLGKGLDKTRQFYPHKEIWVTEFNAGFGFESDPQIDGSGFAYSQDHVKYLRDVANVFKQKGVDLYFVHMLYGSSNKNYAIINNLALPNSIKIIPDAEIYAQPTICAFIQPTSPDFFTYNCQQ